MRMSALRFALLFALALAAFGLHRAEAEPVELGRKLTAWRGAGDFLTGRTALTLAAQTAEGRSAFLARLQLLRFYLGWGLEREAHAVAESIKAHVPEAIQDTEFAQLADIAAIMSDRLAGGDAFFKRIGVANAQDAPLWRAIALSQRSEWRQALAHIEIAAAQIRDYPPVYAERFLPLLMEAALEAKDAHAARTVAQAMTNSPGAVFDQARTGWLSGRLAELEGYPQAALERYRRAGTQSGPWAVRAELRRIEMEMQRGEVDLPAAEETLRTLLVRWRGDRIEQLVLLQLAAVLAHRGEVEPALAACEALVRRFPLSPLTMAARERGAELFRRVYVERGLDGLDRVTALGLRERHAALMPEGEAGAAIDRGYAGMLIESGFTVPAERVVERLGTAGANGEETFELVLRLAEGHMRDGRPDRALDLLQRHPPVPSPGLLADRYRLNLGRALAAAGRHEEASAVLAGLDGPDSLRAAGDAFWLARDWERAETAYRRLFSVLPADAATADEVGRYAVSALMAGDPATATMLYREHRRLLDGSRWATVLSGPPDLPADVPGETMEGIQARLNQVQAAADLAWQIVSRD